MEHYLFLKDLPNVFIFVRMVGKTITDLVGGAISKCFKTRQYE